MIVIHKEINPNLYIYVSLSFKIKDEILKFYEICIFTLAYVKLLVISNQNGAHRYLQMTVFCSTIEGQQVTFGPKVKKKAIRV